MIFENIKFKDRIYMNDGVLHFQVFQFCHENKSKYGYTFMWNLIVNI